MSKVGTPAQVAGRMVREFGSKKFALDMCEYEIASTTDPARQRLYRAVAQVLKEGTWVDEPAPLQRRGGARPGAGRRRLADEHRKVPATLRLTKAEWSAVKKLVARLRGGE